MRERGALAAIVVAAVVLQASRLPFRWNAVTVAYASYFKEYRHTVETDGAGALFTTFVGLHPPAYSMLFLGMLALGAAPIVWMAVSGAMSVAAVPATGAAARAAWGRDAGGAAALTAAAVLALSPHRNAYGLEVNNYPLLMLATALQLWAFAAWAGAGAGSGRRPRSTDVAYGAATVLALYTHVLAIALPAAQLLTLMLHPDGRRRLVRFGAVMGAAAVPCLALLPSILGSAGAPPMNAPAGLGYALRVVATEFPQRFGTGAGAALVGAGLAFGTWRIVARERGLAPLSWVVHAGLVMGLVTWMVATGIAAAHQFPYYVAALPSGALLVGAAFAGRGSGEGAAAGVGGQLVAAAVGLGLLIHAGSQGLAWAAADEAWAEAGATRSLVKLGVDEWEAGAGTPALLLVQFPQFGDDDKDFVDPAWAHVPRGASCRFEHPGVPTLVTADPYAGQPVLLGGRWLYTFTQFEPDRIDPIVRHHLAGGDRVVVVLTEADFGPGEVGKAEVWASTFPGLLGKRAPGQVLWVIDPRPTP